MPRETAPPQAQCAGIVGFTLHAAMRCAARDRKRLGCRYINRPDQPD